eukprot:187945-Pleurochrysis_carterae.AAC.1
MGLHRARSVTAAACQMALMFRSKHDHLLQRHAADGLVDASEHASRCLKRAGCLPTCVSARVDVHAHALALVSSRARGTWRTSQLRRDARIGETMLWHADGLCGLSVARRRALVLEQAFVLTQPT